jgi:hypothetical protein
MMGVHRQTNVTAWLLESTLKELSKTTSILKMGKWNLGRERAVDVGICCDRAMSVLFSLFESDMNTNQSCMKKDTN